MPGLRARRRARASRRAAGGGRGCARPRRRRRGRRRTRRAAAPSPARRPRTSPSRHLGDGAGPGPARETSTVHESARSGRQAGAALGPAAARGPRDRPSCASAGGSRASCSACDCSVGTSSSRMASSNARAATRWGPGAARRMPRWYRRARTAPESTGARRRTRQSTRRAGRSAARCPAIATRVAAELPRRDRSLVALSTALIWSATPVPPGDPVLGTSPAFGPTDQRPRPLRRPVLLHTCGHTCGQPWGAATVGTPAADDLWAKVAAAVRAQLSEATWNTWFQGVHALDLQRRHPDPRRPQLGRRSSGSAPATTACSPTRPRRSPASRSTSR